MTDTALYLFYKNFQHLLLKGAYSVLFIFLCSSVNAEEEGPAYEEISVFLNVASLGGREVEAVIKQEAAYLSVTDVFDYLKIKNKPSSNLDSVSGFFISQNAAYVIDKINNRIQLQDKTFILSPEDLIQTQTGLYLKTAVFGKVFQLDCVFNFRSLSVNLNTKLDLPVIRERRQELMRNNLSQLKREIIADTTINRKYSLFNFGAADWSVISTQYGQGITNTRLNFRLGTIVARGETNVSFNYDSRQQLKLRQQQYQWRYVNNDSKTLRQLTAGKIPAQSVSSIFSPVIGLNLTNTPTTYRRSFGSHTISDYTEPDWMVELYVNNVLVDYVKADASGFFTFQVPIVYGNSALILKFFGPWGEERTREQNINVPYNFLPENETEYSLSAGMLEDGKQSRFSRADFKYGLSQGITIGSGVEYLSSVTAGSVMPFINASIRLASNLLLTGDYTYGVRAKGILNYRLPSNLLVELNYISYKKGQTAINQNFSEERKAIISKPFRGSGFSALSRLTVNQIIYSKTQQTLADLLLSGTVKGVSTNLTTFALFAGSDYLNVYSNLAMALRLPSRFRLRPQLQYGYTYQRINEVRVELEKQLSGRGFLNFTYEKNFIYNIQSFGLGLRFDFSFARTSFFASQSNNRTTFTQSLRGSSVYDSKTSYFNMNNRTNVGRGGLIVYPFLDINANNRRDANEPKIEGLKLKINGGRIQSMNRDTTVHITDLEPYTNYLLELNPNSFDNIAWQMKNTTFKVPIEPNKLTLIEVPVKVSGEASGMVYGTSADSTGQGRIIVKFYRNGTLAGRTVSEGDGYFTFLGLSPGSYTACVDTAQMEKLKMNAYPASIPFNIAATLDGDVISDIGFKLQKAVSKTPAIIEPAPVLAEEGVKPSTILHPADLPSAVSSEQSLQPDVKLSSNNTPQTIAPQSEGSITGTDKTTTIINASGFSIRTSALGDSTRALIAQKYLFREYGHPVSIFFEGRGSYQLSILGFENKTDAEALLPVLAQKGFKGLYIVPPRLRSSIITESSKSTYATPLDPMHKTVDGDVLLPSKNQSVPKIADGATRPKPGIQKDGNAIKEGVMNFAVIIGKADNMTSIKQQQDLIFKILNRTSFPMQNDKFNRLVITGFPDKKTAEEAFQKLLTNGLKDGYITTYKIKSTQLVPVK